MPTIIDGSSGITLPAGGTGNTSGALIGATDVQTLTNKTLTSPTITGAVMSSMGSSVLTQGTAVASTSGTAINFTGIPSWVKRITLMFNGVSTSGTSNWLIQLGSTTVETTGYLSVGTYTGATSSGVAFTAGFGIIMSSATHVGQGLVQVANVTSNTWVANGSLAGSGGGANFAYSTSGTKSLAGVLDRVRLTTVNGTDTFDAGSVNIMYE